MALYGSFPAILYWRVKKHRLFVLTDAERFMDDFVQYYLHNASTAGSSAHSLSRVRALAAIIPKPWAVRALMRYHRFSIKNAMFFKLVVDILTCYYTCTGSPLFKEYKEEVIPLATAIYKSLPQNTIQWVYEKLIVFVTPSTAKLSPCVESKRYLTLFKQKEEYLKYYKAEALDYDNLTAGNTIQTFYV